MMNTEDNKQPEVEVGIGSVVVCWHLVGKLISFTTDGTDLAIVETVPGPGSRMAVVPRAAVQKADMSFVNSSILGELVSVVRRGRLLGIDDDGLLDLTKLALSDGKQ